MLSIATNGTLTTNLFLRTDTNGLAWAYLFMPTNTAVTNLVTVTAVSGTNQVQMQLEAWITNAANLTYSLHVPFVERT